MSFASTLRRGVAVLVVALVLAACGSSGDGAAPDVSTEGTDASAATDVTTVPDVSTVEGSAVEPVGVEVVDPASLDLGALTAEEAAVAVVAVPLPLDHEAMDAIAERTVVLVDRFGVDGAFDALVLAIGRGYSPGVVAAGIESGDLDALGFIAGVEPDLPASKLLELPPAVQGFRSPASTEVEERLTVERLRRNAAAFEQVSERALEPWEAPEIVTGEGATMLWFVQRLADAGFSGDQIVNAIVLGYGGISTSYLQIGMGPAIASCRYVVIGGAPEPIGDGCDGFAERDLELRDRYLDAGFEYPSCEERSIEGVYDACAAENDAASTETADGTSTPIEIDDAAEPTEWSGTMTLSDDAYDGFVPFGPQEVSIARIPGTDEFTIDIESGSSAEKEYALTDEGFRRLATFDPNVCQTETTTTFDGVGQMEESGPRVHIVFAGTQHTSEVRVSCSLEELPPHDYDPHETTVWVDVTDTGLEGSFNYHEFALPGVPSPSNP